MFPSEKIEPYSRKLSHSSSFQLDYAHPDYENELVVWTDNEEDYGDSYGMNPFVLIN